VAVRVRLDRRIRIETPEYTTNAAGEKIESWTTFLTTWAERKDVKSPMNEEIVSMQNTAMGFVEFTIAFPPAIYRPTTLMRVVEIENDDVYNIVGVFEPTYSVKEYLTLKCKYLQQR